MPLWLLLRKENSLDSQLFMIYWTESAVEDINATPKLVKCLLEKELLRVKASIPTFRKELG